ncbi:DUF1194 domain-containing protein [Litoreibacter ponti]|uniref:DUF1194 domain-containing protein n=1 Tax=Litoreibacter ponti TaxID=1510457 RepID=UPI000D319B2A
MRSLIMTLLLSAAPAQAQQLRETGLELVLLADASGSIDAQELAFQRQGYAEALTDPMVLDAIESSIYGSIAVTYVEWATNTAQVVDWTIIAGPDSATAFADALMTTPQRAFGRNAIGTALMEGMRLITDNDIRAPRAVIDFSGDSIRNSSGPNISTARAAVLEAGITINALPILRPEDGRRAGSNLEAEYQERIIGGPGAFMVTAESRATFAEAVRRKLFLEIAGHTPQSFDFAKLDPD